MFPNLREFVNALDAAGELKRIRTPVDPVLGVTALADRESKSPAPHLPSASAQRNDPRFHHLGGQALLCENIAGSDMPLLINAWGSYRRMEMALGCEGVGFDGLAARIAELVKPQPPKSLAELFTKAKVFLPLLRIPPKRLRGAGLCQEVVLKGDQVDLTRLPMIRCWPHDGDFAALGYPAGTNDGIPDLARGPEWDARFRGRYITLAGIHTVHADEREDPKPSSHNIGMYRVQLFGKQRMSMHWHMHHDGARHWRSWKKLGEPMPVAIALGGESIMPYAATAPLPPGISELLLAGFLNGKGIPLVRARTVPLWVPANAEIVIEGYVQSEAGFIDFDPRRPGDGPVGAGAVFEGPFGDHTGFYSLPDRYPLLHVTALTHRRDPIYPTTVVGLPPQEDYFLGKATERIFLPLLKTLIPDIEDYDLPLFGTFHNCAFVKIKKHYPLQGRRVMHSIWGAGQMAWTKMIFVVDDDVDVHDMHAVMKAAAERCDPGRDLEFVHGPLDILDHAAPFLGAGTKLGFDCTRKIAGEELKPIGGASLHGRRGESPINPEPTTPLSAAARAELMERLRAIDGVADAALHEAVGDGWLVVSTARQEETPVRLLATDVWQACAAAGVSPPYLVLVGPEVAVADLDSALFHWCANHDFGRDWIQRLGQGRSLEATGFNAVPKKMGTSESGLPVREWPPIIRLVSE